MARRLAMNAVANAVVAALNVPSFRALCGGGVYRNRPASQAPPYCSVGPCSEAPDDAFGTHYASVVTVPVRVVTSGVDPDGESRSATVLEHALALLDEPATGPVVTGWTVTQVLWLGAQPQPVLFEDGFEGYELVGTFAISVRA